jgi:hypothetical protein
MKITGLHSFPGLMAAIALLATAWPGRAADPIIRDSHIGTVVTPLGGGLFKYEYTVFNDSPAPQWVGELEVWPSIIGYEIPLDHPSVVWDVTSPATWNYRFLSALDYQLEYGVPNPFMSAYVLQWYDVEPMVARMIVPVGFNARWEASEYEPSANGFSFISNLSPVDGPYANLWLDFFRNIGDPPLPGGGLAGGGLPYHVIPEANAAGLTALACLGWAAWRVQRRCRR